MVAHHQIRWVAEKHGFLRKPVPLTGLADPDASMRASITELPEYQTALKVLLADPAAVHLIDKYVGDVSFATNFSPKDVLLTCVLIAAKDPDQSQYDEPTVRRTWEQIEDSLYVSEIHYTLLAPLMGVKLEGGAIELAPGITITPLSDADLLRCLEADLFRDVGMNLPTLQHRVVGRDELPTTGVRFETALGRRVYERNAIVPDGAGFPAGFPDNECDIHALWDLLGPVERVLTVLRLYQPGFVSVPGALRWSENYFRRNGIHLETREHLTRLYAAPGYALEDKDQPGLASLWSALNSERVRRRSALQLALRRLNFAIDRRLVEDRLVDLLVCAEALLLQDLGQGQRTELRFRVSLRAGRAFKCKTYGSRDVFRLMQNAYDVRSTIVHGGEPRQVALPGKGKVDLPDFASAVETMMREGAKTLVLRASGTRVGEPIIEPDITLLCD